MKSKAISGMAVISAAVLTIGIICTGCQGGYDVGYEHGYDKGYEDGYNEGYYQGVADSHLLLGPGDGTERETETLSASFVITDWEQTYYEYSKEYSDYVFVYYEVTNTGNVAIDYYEVYFTVTCQGGNEYYDWTNGLGVGVGETLSYDTIMKVAGDRVVSVEVDDWELSQY